MPFDLRRADAFPSRVVGTFTIGVILMSEKTFRLLIVIALLVLAVNTTVIAIQMPRQAASAQGLSDIYSVVDDISTNVRRIARGSCQNSRIC